MRSITGELLTMGLRLERNPRCCRKTVSRVAMKALRGAGVSRKATHSG